MTNQTYDTDIRRVIKWLHNEAPMITSLIEKKAEWYDRHDAKFWEDWTRDVFDIRTANAFGLVVWCVILGVPTALFDVRPPGRAFAFGDKRENFKYEPVSGSPAPAHPSIGGNFAGTNDALRDLDEIRKMLRMRYAAMICNGNVQFINKMLNFIFNNGKPWDIANQEYFYLADRACQGFPLTYKMFINNWRGKTRIIFDKTIYNYFEQDGQFDRFPAAAISQQISPPKKSPDEQSCSLFSFTANADQYKVVVHGYDTVVPADHRDMVCGVCVWPYLTSGTTARFDYVKLQVVENTTGFGPNHGYQDSMTVLSEDIIQLSTAQAMNPRDGLLCKKVRNDWVWFESAVRFSPVGRSLAIVAVPCDKDGNPMKNLVGNGLYMGQPCCRYPEQTDAYYRANASDSIVGKWTIKNDKNIFLPATAYILPEYASISWMGVEGFNRTNGEENVPPILPGNRTEFVRGNPSIIGSAVTGKTIDYRVGKNTPISERFLAILRERKNDIMFQHSGVPYTVTRED